MKPLPPVRDVSPGRKALYYGGIAVSVAGFLLFGSNFLIIGRGFGDPGAMVGGGGAFIARALGGMAIMAAGRAMMTVAARGLAGSGFLLDPGRARRDLEPWSRMGGGMLRDALEEVPGLGRPSSGPGEKVVEVVRVRCPACKALNDEHDRFCGQCGGPLA